MTTGTTALSVNLNKIALIRNSREGEYPSVVRFAETCLAAGADGITVHPRPDQRHIRPSDVRNLCALVSRHPGIEFNIEGNPFAESQSGYPGFMALVEENRPHQCTLVPDSNDQLTSDHGFDLSLQAEKLQPIIDQLHQWGCRVSLFMDPDPRQIELAATIGADRIELYTGPYAEAHQQRLESLPNWLARYQEAATCAVDSGLGVNAGHDLNLSNLPRFLQCGDILEVSIGHALTVDALTMGMSEAIKRYKKICTQSVD